MKYCDVLTLFVQKRETGNRHYALSCLSFVLYMSFYYNRFIVSVAIISSSSVGITTTVTFESGVDITASSP